MKILIPLDGSKYSEAIIGPARLLAISPMTEFHLISIVKEDDAHSSWFQPPGQDDPHSAGLTIGMATSSTAEGLVGRVAETKVQAEERLLLQATDYLRHIVTQYFPGGTQSQAILGDDPGKAILGYLQQEQMDLVALATHGRTGVGRLLMGSVASELLQASATPLLLVRPQSLS